MKSRNKGVYAKRRQKLRKSIGKNDGILVTGETNVRYLTGFTGDSTYLIVWQGGDDAAVLAEVRAKTEELCQKFPIYGDS